MQSLDGPGKLKFFYLQDSGRYEKMLLLHSFAKTRRVLSFNPHVVENMSRALGDVKNDIQGGQCFSLL